MRSIVVAPWLKPNLQPCRSWRPDSVSPGGAHILAQPVVSESSLWDGAADFLLERVHHDVDVVAEHGVETHAERCL